MIKKIAWNTFKNTGNVDTFLEFTAVYPTSTIIKTNRNEEAVVISQNKNFPDRPIIKLVKDSHGNNILNKVIIDLSKIDNITIKEVID